MRISQDEAVNMASAAKKLHTVKKGQAWLFCPYVPGAAYHTVHWDPVEKQSYQCEGSKCTICPKAPNRKIHVPSLLFKRPYRLHEVDGLAFPQDIICDSKHWTPKIVELTANCIKPFNLPSEPDQLALAWRPGEKQNGTLFFKWLVGRLKGVPEELAELSVAAILPGVIGGSYRDYEERSLDNSLDGRIKHNSNSRSDFNGCNDFDGTPPPEKFVDKIRTHLKGGA